MLILPASAQEELAREQLVNEVLGLALYWTEAVKTVDPDCSVVLAGDHADDPRLAPGRWHVKRDNSANGLPDTYMKITTPSGGYREPDSGVLDELRERDMRRPGNDADALVRAREQRERALAYKGEQARGEAKDDVRLYVKAVESPSTLVNTDVPYTHKASAPKKRAA